MIWLPPFISNSFLIHLYSLRPLQGQWLSFIVIAVVLTSQSHSYFSIFAFALSLCGKFLSWTFTGLCSFSYFVPVLTEFPWSSLALKMHFSPCEMSDVSQHNVVWNVMVADPAFVSPQIVVLAETSRAGKANLYPEYMSIPVMKLSLSPWWKRPNVFSCHRVSGWLTQGLVPYRGLSVGLRWWQIRHSAGARSVSVGQSPWTLSIPATVATVSMHPWSKHWDNWGKRLTHIPRRCYFVLLTFKSLFSSKCSSGEKNIFTLCAHSERSIHISLPQTSLSSTFQSYSFQVKPLGTACELIWISASAHLSL